MQFDSDKYKVRIHNIKEQRLTLCNNCDNFIEHKEIPVNKHFNMKVFQRVEFRNKYVKKIAQMVNYYYIIIYNIFIDSSSSVSNSRAGVPLPAVSLRGAWHGCNQRVKALVHRLIFLFTSVYMSFLIYICYVV